VFHKYLQVRSKPQIATRPKLDSGDLMVLAILMLLLAEGNEVSQPTVLTLLIYLCLGDN